MEAVGDDRGPAGLETMGPLVLVGGLELVLLFVILVVARRGIDLGVVIWFLALVAVPAFYQTG